MSAVAKMVERFRSSAPTSRKERDEMREVGELEEMWFAGASRGGTGKVGGKGRGTLGAKVGQDDIWEDAGGARQLRGAGNDASFGGGSGGIDDLINQDVDRMKSKMVSGARTIVGYCAAALFIFCFKFWGALSSFCRAISLSGGDLVAQFSSLLGFRVRARTR